MQLILICSFVFALIFVNDVLSAPVIKRGGVYRGTATWYKPATEGGSQGACGGVHIDSNSYIVALNRAQYGNMNANSKWCGKSIKITGAKGTATAKIMDACPGCSTNDLDLTPVLFKKVVGDMMKGVGPITWQLA
ncbi:RlpA-like double-psi beta-barrel-protein domain-containing protein-containing protein [Sporodiniella umbellata]|nr:RlpA-like double-psi beta-barrel-protein domain-containing protein-containing protein [Sporodiniella umbellata]